MRSESDRDSCNFDGCMDNKSHSKKPGRIPCDLADSRGGDTPDMFGGRQRIAAFGETAAGKAFWYHRISK